MQRSLYSLTLIVFKKVVGDMRCIIKYIYLRVVLDQPPNLLYFIGVGNPILDEAVGVGDNPFYGRPIDLRLASQQIVFVAGQACETSQLGHIVDFRGPMIVLFIVALGAQQSCIPCLQGPEEAYW